MQLHLIHHPVEVRNRYMEIRALGVDAYAHSGIGLFVVKHLAHNLEYDALFMHIHEPTAMAPAVTFT
jgi:hypothetical protein